MRRSARGTSPSSAVTGFRRARRAAAATGHRRPSPEREASRAGISDLQFTTALPRAVPVPHVTSARHLRVGSLVEASSACCSDDLDGNWAYDLTGSYGVNLFGYDFYKECIDARRRARARRSARCSGPTIRSSRTTCARLQADLGARRGVVPHVGHRSRDAGRAAGADITPPLARRAVLRRLSRLVGRRAARRRQSARRFDDVYTLEGHERRDACACSRRAATSPACS